MVWRGLSTRIKQLTWSQLARLRGQLATICNNDCDWLSIFPPLLDAYLTTLHFPSSCSDSNRSPIGFPPGRLPYPAWIAWSSWYCWFCCALAPKTPPFPSANGSPTSSRNPAGQPLLLAPLFVLAMTGYAQCGRVVPSFAVLLWTDCGRSWVVWRCRGWGSLHRTDAAYPQCGTHYFPTGWAGWVPILIFPNALVGQCVLLFFGSPWVRRW